jgi:Xaa-Pro aminopeptidase
VRDLLQGSEVVYTQGLTGTVSAAVRSEISRLTGEAPRNSPHTVGSAETFLAPLRLIKSASEVAAIREAGEVTGEVLHAVLPLLEPGSSEREVGALIDYYYRLCGGCPGFETIVAAGPSAATLHYHALTRSIKDGDMVLIDTGIELGLYNADITRTIPVGTISEAQGVMYDSVLRAQYAAIKKVKHNALIRDIYLAAAKELTIGLKEVGILKGQLSTLVSKGAYKPYFPHGIGHSLGIDVHDVGGLRGNQEARLQKGMVFTIEPGLYFPKATKHLPACGVRIEDDVVVTASGCINLTEKVFPKERDAMARVMAG